MEKIIKNLRLRWVFAVAITFVLGITFFALPPIWQKSYTDMIKADTLGFFEPTEDKLAINTANKTELMGLPSIGEKRAEKIIADRTVNGSFENAESLARVPGITKTNIDKIKMLISYKRDEEK